MNGRSHWSRDADVAVPSRFRANICAETRSGDGS